MFPPTMISPCAGAAASTSTSTRPAAMANCGSMPPGQGMTGAAHRAAGRSVGQQLQGNASPKPTRLQVARKSGAPAHGIRRAGMRPCECRAGRRSPDGEYYDGGSRGPQAGGDPRATPSRRGAEQLPADRSRYPNPEGQAGRVMPMRRETPRKRGGGRNGQAAQLPPGRSDPKAGIQVRRSDVVSKQIITRAEGSRLGKVVNLWVDTRSWEVISLDCVPPTNVLKEIVGKALGNDIYSVLLGSLRQIGDVVLVQDTTALEMEDYSYGYRDLVAMDIRSQEGQLLGKVRDFVFSPDTGRLSEIVFDMFGSPSVPTSAVSTFSIGVEQVIRVEPSQITVIDGYQVQQLSRGFLDNFFESAGRQFSELFDEPGYYAEEDSGKSYEERLAEWRESVRQYEAQYGPVPQEVQQQASAALQAQRGPDPGEMQRRGAAGGSYYEREQAPPPTASQSASVPIISRRRRQSYEVRDADGGVGEAPPPNAEPPRRTRRQEREPASSSGVPISDWLTEDQRQAEREEMLAGGYYDEIAASPAQQSLRFGGGSGVGGGRWAADEGREPQGALDRAGKAPAAPGGGDSQQRQRRGAARRFQE